MTNVTVNTAGGGTTFELTGAHANCNSGDIWTYTISGGKIDGGPCNP